MNATAVMERAGSSVEKPVDSKETRLRFEEGLIGFPDSKEFVLLESPGLDPFRLLQAADNPDLAFLVLDPSLVVDDYHVRVHAREWETLGLDAETGKIALVICLVGPTPAECTGNFQAPLLINYKTMTGRQVILNDTGLSVRQPLLASPVN